MLKRSEINELTGIDGGQRVYSALPNTELLHL